ncbi:LmbU family transcriptional regulator [Paractinoplanes lichenicola]|uniref:LmbU family transcriptional regulator n=1 Tax=Paractinoplanes lichenicola TaxID=2802976 RepID=UPI001F37F778|nr:LmbU family transcriptional regulator [Actinoplanes lichenicola]
MRAIDHNQKKAVGGNDGFTQNDVVVSFAGQQATVLKSGMLFPQNLSERSWEQLGTSLRELANSSAWWLADWLVFGEAAYGWRRYREAIERTGLDYQTLRNYTWVARRFEQGRRHDSLSFAHHAELARLPPSEQDYWLRKAEQQKWSRNELRKAVRSSLAERSQETQAPVTKGEPIKAVPSPAESAGAGKRRRSTIKLTIEVSASQWDCYAKFAATDHLSVEEWVTRVLDAADRRAA